MTTQETIQQSLTAKFGTEVSNFTDNYGILTFTASKDINLKVMNYLLEENTLGFSWLNDLTVVHYPDNVGAELEVVYLLQNMQTRTRIRMKCPLDIADPTIFTASSLHASANWQEREAYDFFGVNFKGHPNLIRIMNVDEMDYFPLRKEFPLEDQTRIDKDDEMFGRTSKEKTAVK
jgi:NADH-quinone oxidoreductase subunit C